VGSKDTLLITGVANGMHHPRSGNGSVLAGLGTAVLGEELMTTDALVIRRLPN